MKLEVKRTEKTMTDEEKQQLGHLGIGEVVLFRENEHVRVNIIVLPFEQPLVFTS